MIDNRMDIWFLCLMQSFQVHAAMENYPPYQLVFAKISCRERHILDKAFGEEEVNGLCLAFELQVRLIKHEVYLDNLRLFQLASFVIYHGNFPWQRDSFGSIIGKTSNIE